jgi:hypothetical protein
VSGAVPVPDERMEQAETRGWAPVPGFEQPVQLHIYGEWLSIRDEEHAMRVPVTQVRHLAVKEFSAGKTMLLVALPFAGAALLALSVQAYCKLIDGCSLVYGN